MASIFNDFTFSEQDFQEIQLMCQYNKVTNFKNVVGIEFEGRHYKIYEQYCKNPDCPCTEVNIDFVHFENNEIKGICYVIYNYEEQKVLETSPFFPQGLIDLLKESDELHALFRVRNADMRYAFAAHCAKRKLANKNKMFNIVKTIGRNEPCPCGSGRKYKNCCGK